MLNWYKSFEMYQNSWCQYFVSIILKKLSNSNNAECKVQVKSTKHFILYYAITKIILKERKVNLSNIPVRKIHVTVYYFSYYSFCNFTTILSNTTALSHLG